MSKNIPLGDFSPASRPFPSAEHRLMQDFMEACMRTEQSSIYPIKDETGKKYDTSKLLHVALGLTTEVGEAVDPIKKSLFYGKAFDRTNVLEELGDAMWYMAVALDTLDSSFEECCSAVINKLRARYPDKYSNEDALSRDIPSERAILEENLCDTVLKDPYDPTTNHVPYLTTDVTPEKIILKPFTWTFQRNIPVVVSEYLEVDASVSPDISCRLSLCDTLYHTTVHLHVADRVVDIVVNDVVSSIVANDVDPVGVTTYRLYVELPVYCNISERMTTPTNAGCIVCSTGCVENTRRREKRPSYEGTGCKIVCNGLSADIDYVSYVVTPNGWCLDGNSVQLLSTIDDELIAAITNPNNEVWITINGAALLPKTVDGIGYGEDNKGIITFM